MFLKPAYRCFLRLMPPCIERKILTQNNKFALSFLRDYIGMSYRLYRKKCRVYVTLYVIHFLGNKDEKYLKQLKLKYKKMNSNKDGRNTKTAYLIKKVIWKTFLQDFVTCFAVFMESNLILKRKNNLKTCSCILNLNCGSCTVAILPVKVSELLRLIIGHSSY